MTVNDYVVGMGEVGKALTEVLNCGGRDIEPPDDPHTTTTLHIAFPWTEGFVSSVHRYIFQHRPRLTVIHSTVPVGTCDRYGWVHSPVTGRHPDLVRSLTAFGKFFGGARAIEAAESWPGMSHTTDKASNTEAGKLWELAQFGAQVRMTQRIYEYCEEMGLDPEIVYEQFARNYNRGYRDVGESRFVRPVLDYVPGPIGGHCVQAGIDMLNDDIFGEH